MEITRIDSDKNVNQECKRITIKHAGESYTITPEYKGIRVHKHSIDDELWVHPSCSNEIVVK